MMNKNYRATDLINLCDKLEDEFIGTWDSVSAYTWDGLSTKEILQNLYIDEDTQRVYYRSTNDGNATLIFDTDGRPYARYYEGE